MGLLTEIDGDDKLPMLNLGCGRILLPAVPPVDRRLADEAVYLYPHWLNVDKIAGEGIEQVDLFIYPWDWQDNSFSGALVEHVAEHIPHKIIISEPAREQAPLGYRPSKRARELENLSNGFYAFFSELSRVLIPGAIAHVVVPYANSWEAHIDPDHKRQFVPATFGYLCDPVPNAPYIYNVGSRWRFAADVRYLPSNQAADLKPFYFEFSAAHLINSISYFYVQLENLKELGK